MVMNRLSRFCTSPSLPLSSSEFMPGIMPSTCEIGPMLSTVWNCSYMSWSENVPGVRPSARARSARSEPDRVQRAMGWPRDHIPCSRLLIRPVVFSMLSSCTFSTSPLMSPIPTVPAQVRAQVRGLKHAPLRPHRRSGAYRAAC